MMFKHNTDKNTLECIIDLNELRTKDGFLFEPGNNYYLVQAPLQLMIDYSKITYRFEDLLKYAELLLDDRKLFFKSSENADKYLEKLKVKWSLKQLQEKGVELSDKQLNILNDGE